MEHQIHIAITGTTHYFGTSFLKPGQVVHLVKDPENPYDQEAIKAVIPPIGKIGYIANSMHTVPKGCRSAGRIYDSFDQQICGVIRFIVKDLAIVELVENIEGFYMIHLSESDSFPLR
ncbi:HIRAN domain-containing protein [Paenibacillus sp. KQZ6P-2]|uniref:HIRAN domain-containing protein n=1 Tax=Paenibacillus mangrovi TaxID=2931978 RepID=A0A9X1WSF7_9BACL|nr:HIRAN domain-containing protein [Paenibacillus mangrovi]MCJ8014168.1 HIRAN domain-containing protein [Paenibacillus mangrovi]